MKISTVLDHIDSGHVVLPEFQRGYVWSRDQVRRLFDSLYRRYPIGGLLVWVTEAKTAIKRGQGPVTPGIVKLLLDGQQRMTTLYGVARGKPPRFFDGDDRVFTGLRFHLGSETFAFYQKIKMQDDPLWIDVSELLASGFEELGALLEPGSVPPEYVGRLLSLKGILDFDLHVHEVTGPEKTVDVVVNIFNRVNSGGTKLSKGDLALAKICAEWPEARSSMKAKLKQWANAGYTFSLDWLLRSVNTVLTGEAKFSHLHNKTAHDIQSGLERASKHIDTSLNLISGRLGLDHDRVFFGRYAIPVMARYLDRWKEVPDIKERDRLLFWFVQTGMWGRFSGSTETFIDQDLAALEESSGDIDALINKMRLWHGRLRIEPGHFIGWSRGARFYPVLYMLTRMGQAQDLGTGLPLKKSMLGTMNRLEVHHIFPKARLYPLDYTKDQVNALANFCFLTKNTNLKISSRLPEEYFEEVARDQPGALESQWIPMDRSLWKIERFLEFLEARRSLLAAEANSLLLGLLHGDEHWLAGAPAETVASVSGYVGGIASENEEAELEKLNEWVVGNGLPRGQIAYDYADPVTGEQKAVFDLAWPNGLQPGLTRPTAVLLNETAHVLSLASVAGFRFFTETDKFRNYVQTEVLMIP